MVKNAIEYNSDISYNYLNCIERYEDMINHSSYTQIAELLMLSVHCITVSNNQYVLTCTL